VTTVLFVHGTGVRRGYDDELRLVTQRLQRRLPEVTVAPCHWAAEAAGLRADLRAEGVSIPSGRFARGDEDEEDEAIRLWAALYGDPLYELRVLVLLPGVPEDLVDPDETTVELEALRASLERFTPSEALRALLRDGGVEAVFDEARGDIAVAQPLTDIIQAATQPALVVRAAIARAVVAQSILLAERDGRYATIAYDASLRDSVVRRLDAELSGKTLDLGATDLLKAGVGRLIGHTATWYLRRDSSIATSFMFPFSGDIMRYQRDGEPIRAFIRDRIAEAKLPVVLLAHSLGGVICFDLLNQHNLSDQVTGLVTVGSQAPLLYELDVLAGLRYGQPLAAWFPQRWLNIYDLRDMLSFVGAAIFPGQIEDQAIDNGQPFPRAHSAYWANEQVWDAISGWLSR
jgi:hypothetical protein